MRYLFLSLFFITVITTYANDARGYKVLLASFKTLEEANNQLDTFGSQLTPEEIEFQNRDHFEIVARPSGKVFIIALEPFEDEQSANTIANHFKKVYPDALVNNYFGPTEGAIVWKNKEETPIKADEKSSIETNRVLPPKKSLNKIPVTDEESSGYVWEIITGLSILLIVVFFWFTRVKKRKKVSTHSNQIEKVKTHLFSTNGWKYNDALERAGGDKEQLKLAIQAFLIDSPRVLNDLKEAFKRGEFLEMQLRAHTLKGLAATIASSTLRTSAQRLEFSSREKNRELAESNLYDCEAVLEKIIAILQDSPIHEDEHIKSMHKDPALLTSSLEILRDNLRKCIFVDVSQFKIFEIVFNGEKGTLMEELKICIEKLDYTKALELIEQIEKMDS